MLYIDLLKSEVSDLRKKQSDCIDNGYYDLAFKYSEIERDLISIIERMEEVEVKRQ